MRIDLSGIAGLIQARHPNYASNMGDWEKWRLTYDGGDAFRERYLKKMSTRETHEDFRSRKELTPVPAFAKAAVNDIRNSIFQRMRDIIRIDGSTSYSASIEGRLGGVDRRGSTMNAFLGQQVLGDLLVMGMVGIYVDNSRLDDQPTLAGVSPNQHPYIYAYSREDILSWSTVSPEQPHEFSSLLLRDTIIEHDQRFNLPEKQSVRYRHLWLENGGVMAQYYDADGNPTDDPVRLKLTRIPFVMLDIGDSLLKDVCDYQIALLNLVSSDISYAHKANFPFYTEQRDQRGAGQHLKTAASEDGTATAGGQRSGDHDVTVGTIHGRSYDLGTDRPQYIAPPTEPLLASMKLQDKLEGDIRRIINLAVQTLATRESAESKQLDNQGLEAGLSYIGLVLEQGERKIAEFWSDYEGGGQRAHIKYPESYSLKSESQRIDEADKLGKFMSRLPGRSVKRELAKSMVSSLLNGKIPVERINQIHAEIDASDFTTSDPETIIAAKENGLVGERTASVALGFADEEYLQAREDHVERLKRLAETQGVTNPAARGADDLDPDPAKAGKDEKAESRDTTFSDTTKKPVRGKGKSIE